MSLSENPGNNIQKIFINMFKHVPLTLRMLLITVMVGVATWGVLDPLQTRNISKTFNIQLNDKLQEDAHESRLLMNKYIQSFHQIARLILSQKIFYDYIEEVGNKKWSSVAKNADPVTYIEEPPQWMPRSSILRLFPHFHYSLLIDNKGFIREVYKNTSESLPQAVLQPSYFLLQLSHQQNLMTTIDNKPYMVATESLHDSQDNLLATLLLATPIDDEFLISSQGSGPSQHMVALIGGTPPKVFASNMPNFLHTGISLKSLQDKYVYTGKGFFDYGTSDLQLQFATFIPRNQYTVLSESILFKERVNRIITGLLLILSFSILMVWITKRVQGLTDKVVDFSDKALDIKPQELRRGDELKVLEKSFYNLIHEIMSSHESIKKQAESLLHERDMAQKYLDVAGVMIVALNSDQSVALINRKGCEILGYNEEEIIGKNWFDNFLPDKIRDEVKAIFISLMAGNIKPDEYFENPVLTKNGEERIIAWHNTVLEDDMNNIIGTLGSGEDITKRRLAEAEAVRAAHLASIGELAAGVAHEINNPINGVLNYTQILADKMSNGSTEEDMLQRILKEGNRVSEIVSSLLSFARQNKDKKMSVNVNDILSETLTLTMTQLRKDNIHVDIHMPEHLQWILANPQQLQQVFLNILNNARYALNQKYPGLHEYKKIEIRGNGKSTMNDSLYVRISFLDHGTGIPVDNLNKVLNPFFTTKPSGIGTGLGLSISDGFIKDHGGYLKLESEQGEFTKVIIDLPVMEQDER